jgi:DHA1 family bicyclomycin/chloramphenicol resistance-like MFS transporter
LWIPVLGSVALLAASVVGINLPVFMLGSFVFIASLGWITPNAMASALTTHGQTAGSAAALIGAMQYLFATLVGAGVGLLHDGSVRPLALVMAICASMAWCAHRLLVRSPQALVAD